MDQGEEVLTAAHWWEEGIATNEKHDSEPLVAITYIWALTYLELGEAAA
jgi:hypothetical protein